MSGFLGKLTRPWMVALALAIVYTCWGLATTDMGFTRDESFYFKFAEVYQDWFVEVGRADGEEASRLLGRTEVKKVWKQNFEHPPLMKVLFGLSWRAFGEKRRPVTIGENGQILVGGLSTSSGFDLGDEVVLLKPIRVGQDPGASSRDVAVVDVVERGEESAEVGMRKWECGSAEECGSGVVDLCGLMVPGTDPDGEGVVLRGCEVRSNGTLEVLSESDAYRLPGILFGALIVVLIFLIGVAYASRTVGLIASLLYAFMPHGFFHAHMTCFDVPITALSLLLLYSFVRSLKSNVWAVVTGLVWGLALLTKLNAFFLPITLVVWWVVAHLREFRWQRGEGLALPPFPRAFLWMLLLGPAMLFAAWPWLWYDSFQGLGQYMAFHLKHDHYYQYYFGTGYQAPPFPIDYPFVFTAITTPTITLMLALSGFIGVYIRPLVGFVGGCWSPRLKSWTEGWGPWGRDGIDSPWGRKLFLLIHLGFPMALIAMPSTPIFGGIKHWLLSYPFACLLGAGALVWMIKRAGQIQFFSGLMPALKHGLATLLVVLVLAPAARDTVLYTEYGTAYYNELIGGFQGAADQRMQRQFWSYANRGALNWVNRHAPQGASIDFQDATVGTCAMYQREGWMRQDLKCVARAGSPQVMLFDVEERFSEEEMRYWNKMDTLGPVDEVSVHGVPMVRIYEKGSGYKTMIDRYGRGGDSEGADNEM